MVQKTVSLTPEIYSKLRARKKPDETFSQLIARMLGEEENKEELSDFSFKSFAGVLKEDDEWDEIEEILEQRRIIRRPILFFDKDEEDNDKNEKNGEDKKNKKNKNENGEKSKGEGQVEGNQ